MKLPIDQVVSSRYPSDKFVVESVSRVILLDHHITLANSEFQQGWTLRVCDDSAESLYSLLRIAGPYAGEKEAKALDK